MRGKKKRYSVYKAEECLLRESDEKDRAEKIAAANGYSIQDFYPDNMDSKTFWQETCDNITDYKRQQAVDYMVTKIHQFSKEILSDSKSRLTYPCVRCIIASPISVDREKVEESIKQLNEILELCQK